jgi:hypothetical protein
MSGVSGGKKDSTSGVTDSERELYGYVSKSFLKLWSYPNLFIDKRSNGGKTEGKELCDVLVVCGPHVIIFSDKSIEWPGGSDVSLSWSRWRRRAIDKSVDQIRGAARWIRDFPDRIFLDRECRVPLPISLPHPDVMQVHGVVVARGAGEACKLHFGSGSGSLIVHSAKLEELDRGSSSDKKDMFSIGDVNPKGFYAHVLDDTSLNVVIEELDTITDFVWYLQNKAEVLRSPILLSAHGEEELLTSYLRGMDYETGKHDILAHIPDRDKFSYVLLSEGLYAEWRQTPEYKLRKRADESSYAWDRLIGHFSDHVLDGTVVDVDGMVMNESVADHERALREMALQCRMQRRILVNGMKGAFEGIKDKDRFYRLMLSNTPFGEAKTGFIFLVFKNNERTNANGIYSEYRRIRATTLYGYAINSFRKRPELTKIVGISAELPGAAKSGGGGSEDLIYMESPDVWDDELIKEADNLKETLEIFNEDTVSETALREFEYVDVNQRTRSKKFDNPINYSFVEPPALVNRKRSPANWRPKIGRNDPCTCGSGKKYKKCCLI